MTFKERIDRGVIGGRVVAPHAASDPGDSRYLDERIVEFGVGGRHLAILRYDEQGWDRQVGKQGGPVGGSEVQTLADHPEVDERFAVGPGIDLLPAPR